MDEDLAIINSNTRTEKFKNFFVEDSDTGDFYSATSYPVESKPLITVDPSYQQLLTDLIDLRPRVATYDTSSSIS